MCQFSDALTSHPMRDRANPNSGQLFVPETDDGPIARAKVRSQLAHPCSPTVARVVFLPQRYFIKSCDCLASKKEFRRGRETRRKNAGKQTMNEGIVKGLDRLRPLNATLAGSVKFCLPVSANEVPSLSGRYLIGWTPCAAGGKLNLKALQVVFR